MLTSMDGVSAYAIHTHRTKSSPKKERRTAMPDNGIKRITVGVSDLKKAADFFINEMELTAVTDSSIDSDSVSKLYGLDCAAEYIMLKNDEQDTLLQLIHFTGHEGTQIRSGANSWDFGYYDIAFRAKDNTKSMAHFKSHGYDYYCMPTRYVADWINLDVLEAVLKGPDALPIALIERLKEPIPKFDGNFSIFTDVAQTVADGEEATRFYVNVLGLTKVFDEVIPDGLVDEIVSVPTGTHTRMLMYAGGNTPITECLEYSLKGKYLNGTAIPGNYGVFATAYQTDNLLETVKAAADNGFRVLRECGSAELAPYGRISSAFIEGPSKMLVEFFQVL